MKNAFKLVLSNKRGTATLFNRIASQAGYNAMEGAVSTAASNLVDNIANADNSHLEEKKQAYIAQGFSEEDAEKKAMVDCFIIEPLIGGAVGAVGGAAIGAGTVKRIPNIKPKGDYSPEYASKLKDTHKSLKKVGYNASEHSLNRVLGRINQGKISSVEDVIDTLKTGTKYLDKEHGGIIIYKNGISVHISDDGTIKTIIGNSKVKSTWEAIK